MRERLYRGKRTDNGEWVDGNHLYDNISGKHYIVPFGNITESTKVGEDGCCYCVGFEVILETVGEYTGLTDKNGKKIFEGDVIKTKKYGKVIMYSNINDYDVFKVVYQPAVYRLENRQRGFNLVDRGFDYEVIGNIHDTLELLEVTE